MRKTITSAFIVTIIASTFIACVKETEKAAQDTGILPTTCGSDGHRLQATIDGVNYCGNAQVIATGDSTTVIATGVDLLGNTIVVQADSLVVGEQAINMTSNGVLLIQSGSTYNVTPDHPGTLTISQIDTSAHVFKASFDVMLHCELSGVNRHVVGNCDVVYTVGQ
ncbi:MAG TPA: hypothetical protein PK760_00330 [Flavobacteriales bacterium]|nr:hypothetical protein [Flavobacteriales bacterium]